MGVSAVIDPATGAATVAPPAAATEPWWQQAVGYQIYPASFQDSNGDGVGDVPGIIARLDHLVDLGIGFIWLSPVYASPMVDNGYDIADYQAINPRFGTLADMDRLIAEAGRRGLRIVMDLVVNHSSDQHRWFQDARTDPQSPYRDYYIWRDAPPVPGAPDDLQSTFGGPAWTKDAVCGRWYFHNFAPQQPDLNWSNPAMRADIYRMMNWWLDRGIGGFRMDVIDLIGKDVAHGILADGPMLHPYLQEMHRATLAGRDMLSVGEVWSATPDTAVRYSAPDAEQLSMVFQFEQVTRFWDVRLGKWSPKPVDLPTLKQIFAKWQGALHGKGWNSLFWGNHDLPRAVSRYGDDCVHRVASAKLLATILHLMEGTPFVYQGEEIGMTNADFTRIDQYRDVETLGLYHDQIAAGVSPSAFLKGARASSRDNARTPMQWEDRPEAGFTTGTPWLPVNANYPRINVAADRTDPDGVFERYKALIALRRTMPIIRHGDFRLLLPDDDQIFAYLRTLGDEHLLVLANMSPRDALVDTSGIAPREGTDLLTGQPVRLRPSHPLAPYEVVVLV
jgi:oligo-1,6-glucosidase